MRFPILGGVVAALVLAVLALSAAVMFVPAPSPMARVIRSLSLAPSASEASSTTPSGSGSPVASSATSPPVGLQVGDQAPSLALPRLGGGTVDLAALRGRPVWVNFMATWCPECQDELPLMEMYAPELGDSIQIVLVDVREGEPDVAAFAQQMHLSLPVALDTDGRAQRAWAAYALPMHFWLDADGIVRAVAYGGLGPPQFLQNVRQVVPGASLNP